MEWIFSPYLYGVEERNVYANDVRFMQHRKKQKKMNRVFKEEFRF